MPANTRTIKRRIKSVKNTKKITKAMELVAASKMRKATAAVVGTRPFTQLAWETVRAIAKVTDPATHPLLAPRTEVKRVLFVLFTSDRGLCGGFNVRMIKEATKALGVYHEVEVDTITVGRRGADAMRRIQKNIIASFTDLTNTPKFTDTLPISKLVLQDYAEGKYDKVAIAYTDFRSAITQTPRVIDLLPLKPDEEIGEIGEEERGTRKEEKQAEYRFEPSPKEVLDAILPRIVETMVWQALLESAASEHSARMMAMRSASDAAGEMIDNLTFTFNQIRQAGITREIAEISAGKAALE